MNAKVKNVLIIVAKNAVNAVLTNAGLMALFHNFANVTTAAGWLNIGKVTLVSIATREAMVWGPVILRWSTTNSTPNGTPQ